MAQNNQRRRVHPPVADPYTNFNRIIAAGLVGQPSGTLGEESGDGGGDSSGCIMPDGTDDAAWKAYKKCQGDYWGASAGDCHTFTQRAQSNLPADRAWCKSQGGTDPEPCIELAHSCVSTVVCQVFNYLYANGSFTKECGKYGEPVGDVIWWASGFQTAAALIGNLVEEIKCIGADTGSCWPNAQKVHEAFALRVYTLLGKLTDIWNTQRSEAGLPSSMVCIDAPFLSLAAMIGRGEVPTTLDESSRKLFLEAMASSTGYKPTTWKASCEKMAGCECPPNTFDLESSIVELSLWTDPNGFRKDIQTSQIAFLNTKNWAQAVSWGIGSGVQLVNPSVTKKLSPISMLSPMIGIGLTSGIQDAISEQGQADQIGSPVMLPAGSKSLKLFKGTAEQSSSAPNQCAFNIGIWQKGGPEKCKSIAASNDSKVCANIAKEVLTARLEAVYRVLPLVVGAMTAHNAHYAMIWKQAHSPIPINTKPDPGNILARAALDYAAQAGEGGSSSGTSALKVLLSLGIVGAAGYGAWKYWPKGKK